MNQASHARARASTLLKGVMVGVCVILTSGGTAWVWDVLAAPAAPRRLSLASITTSSLIALLLTQYLVRRRLLAVLRDARRVVTGGPRTARAEREKGTVGRLARAVDRLAFRVSSLRAAIRATRAEQAALLGSMAGGVLVLDRERRVIDLNRAGETMLGIRVDHARGRLLQEVVRQPDLHRLVERAFTGSPDPGEDLTFSGTPVKRARAAVSPVIGHDGRLSGLLIVLNDITRLRRLERLRTDFAANVSHELRTPITNIKGYIETLLDTRMTDRDQSLEFLRVIARNADRLSAIIEDILVLTQLERPDAREGLDLSEIDPGPVIEAVVNEAERAAGAKGMRIIVEAEDGLRVRANAPLLQQAIGNLIENAIKYSQAQSRVRVRASATVGSDGALMARIDVADEGPGIAESHLSRLFERFYRVDRARSREQGGTGLGLAIVKHIAEVHAGRVEVASVPGQGSTFSIFVPGAEQAVPHGSDVPSELRPVFASQDLDTI